ncbi:MAG: N4-gp56 family major capsid protein [Deltaproteobacteria bacterium]|nr:N4-gp56 family major capsid protein [Deltaproteobacteria bacterium]
MSTTKYGDITPRTAGYIAREMLRRGLPLLILEKFMQAVPLPKNNTLSVLFRRYESLGLALTALTEGVTPNSKKLTVTDVTVTLVQQGSIVELTDVIADTHEDNVQNEAVTLSGEEAAQTIETLRFNVLKAGTNKFYANGAARTSVNTPITTSIQKKIVRALKRQNAMPITSIVKSSTQFNTEAVLPCYVAVTHTDLENDIRDMDGFIDVKDYGHSVTPFEGEIGAVGQVRYLISNIFTAYEDAGGVINGMVSTSGVKADVYPIIYMAKHFWAGVALKGQFAIVPMVLNPGIARGGDELGQRGTVGWKTYSQSVILNDFFGAVAEVGASDL